MSLSELLQWWNLVFVLPFGLAVLYLLLLASGTVAVGDTDTDADVAADVDVHADVDVPADIDHDIGDMGHDVVQGEVMEHHAALSGAHDHDTDSDGLLKVLSALGFGKVPLSLLLMCFCFVWGFTGWVGNQIFKNILPSPAVYFWLSLGLATFCALLFTQVLAFGFAKYLPSVETYGVSGGQLVGKRATVRFRITESSGTAQLYDDYGNLHEVSCRVKPGEENILQGQKVVLMDYDAQKQVFIVRPDPLEERGLDFSPTKGMLN